MLDLQVLGYALDGMELEDDAKTIPQASNSTSNLQLAWEMLELAKVLFLACSSNS